jgi:hypothetical protein
LLLYWELSREPGSSQLETGDGLSLVNGVTVPSAQPPGPTLYLEPRVATVVHSKWSGLLFTPFTTASNGAKVGKRILRLGIKWSGA